jgi:hypothetical protein
MAKSSNGGIGESVAISMAKNGAASYESGCWLAWLSTVSRRIMAGLEAKMAAASKEWRQLNENISKESKNGSWRQLSSLQAAAASISKRGIGNGARQ